MPNNKLLPGIKIGSAVLRERRLIKMGKRNRAVWVCSCGCGITFEVLEHNMLAGNKLNCGCKNI